jgi:hypothetical protein
MGKHGPLYLPEVGSGTEEEEASCRLVIPVWVIYVNHVKEAMGSENDRNIVQKEFKSATIQFSNHIRIE